MKFREFVGEDKVKEVEKKIVQTNIGPTEEEFLKQVLIEKPEKYLGPEYYLSFSLDKRSLKRVFDYIKSWLIRYHVKFRPINPYLTLYVLNNLPEHSIIVNKIKKNKGGVIYKPKGTLTLERKKGKDIILLDYFKNDYNKVLENLFTSMGINIVVNKSYIRLFEIEGGALNNRIFEDIIYSCPRLPNLRLGNVGLSRS